MARMGGHGEGAGRREGRAREGAWRTASIGLLILLGAGCGMGVPSAGFVVDDTYAGHWIGQLHAEYLTNQGPRSLVLQVTLDLAPSAPGSGGVQVYRVTEATVNHDHFGCRFGCTTVLGSSFLFPDPPQNVNTVSAPCLLLFANGTDIQFSGDPGDVHQSTDGRTISSTVDARRPWWSASLMTQLGIQEHMFTRRTWVFNKSAL